MQYLPEHAGACYCLAFHAGHLYAGTVSRPGQVFKWATLSFSADIHLNALSRSLTAMNFIYRYLTAFSGDGHLMRDSPWATTYQIFKLDTALWGTRAAILGNVTFATSHDLVLGLAVDTANNRAFASINSGHVEAVDLATFTATGSVATNLTSQYFMVLDTDGFGFVGENNNPGKIVRVKLGAVPSAATAITLTGHDRAHQGERDRGFRVLALEPPRASSYAPPHGLYGVF
jgi:hypothetical protein